MKTQLYNKLSENVEGIFAINKPIGISSQKAVQKVKWWAREKSGNKKIKVGHGGTLDPLAEGVLVVAIGRQFTKQIDKYVASEKVYRAETTFGKVSETDDSEGPISDVEVNKIPKIEEVKQTITKFIGEIEQTPPVYSAIKINGQEAYKRIRRGEEVEMKSRKVFVKEIEILNYDYPKLELRIICAKGVYIRSLARDIGKKLGVGAYMSALVRERVGNLGLSNSLSLEMFETKGGEK